METRESLGVPASLLYRSDSALIRGVVMDFMKRNEILVLVWGTLASSPEYVNPYPTAFPYGNGMVLHFYQQQESSTTKTVHKVINKGLKAYV